MRKIHQYWKLVVIGFVLGVHVLSGLIGRVLLSGPRKRAFNISNFTRHSRIILAVLGVKVEFVGGENWREGQTYLVVANHMSYIDMLAFACVRPVCFVSTVEVLETPFLGPIAEASGSYFVERRSRDGIKKEISDIAGILQQGFSMGLFPEGTSTNGEQVLPFKRPLFAPAERTNTPVLPVALEYTSLNGDKVTRSNRDLLCYYGAMEFSPHFLTLAGCQGATVRLTVLPEIPITETITREEIASRAQAAIAEKFKPFT